MTSTLELIDIHGTKPSASSKLGITYTRNPNGNGTYLITGISTDSIFSAGDDVKDGEMTLCVGMELRSINGTSIVHQDKAFVQGVFTSLGAGKVIFTVSKQFQEKFEVTFSLPTASETAMYRNYNNLQAYLDSLNPTITTSRSYTKAFLTGKGVPDAICDRIYDVIEKDLFPNVKSAADVETIFLFEMMEYQSKQMNKGHVGWGLESGHEEKVLRMLHHCCALSSSAQMVAANVLSLTNALVRKHNILCQLVTEPYTLQKFSKKKQSREYQSLHIRGVEFIPL